VRLLPEAVAGVVVERMVDAGLQRHAETAEIPLSSRSHPLERSFSLLG